MVRSSDGPRSYQKTQFIPAPTIMPAARSAAPMAISMATADHGGMGFRAACFGHGTCDHFPPWRGRGPFLTFPQRPERGAPLAGERQAPPLCRGSTMPYTKLR
jgi:hypothetical protein